MQWAQLWVLSGFFEIQKVVGSLPLGVKLPTHLNPN